MKHYYRITTIAGQKVLTRRELEDMIYSILVTGQVDLNEMPYLFGYDLVKNSDEEHLKRFLKGKVRTSAYRMAKHLFEENIISIKE